MASSPYFCLTRSTLQVSTVPGLSDKLWDIPSKPRALTDSFATLPRDDKGAAAREELDMRVTRKSRAPGLTRCEDPLEVLAPFRSLGELRQELLAKNRHSSILVLKNATNYVLTLQEAVLDRGAYGRCVAALFVAGQLGPFGWAP